MALKDLAVPALCVLGTLYFVKGCEKEKGCTTYHRSYTPSEPQCRTYQEPEQDGTVYYEENYTQPVPVQRRVIRRVIRRTTTPIYQNYYYEY